MATATAHEPVQQELSVGEIDPKDVLLVAQLEVQQFVAQQQQQHAVDDENDTLDNDEPDESGGSDDNDDDDAWRFAGADDGLHAHRRYEYSNERAAASAVAPVDNDANDMDGHDHSVVDDDDDGNAWRFAGADDFDDEFGDGSNDESGDVSNAEDDDVVRRRWSAENEQRASRFDTDAAHSFSAVDGADHDDDGHDDDHDHDAAKAADGSGSHEYDAMYRRFAYRHSNGIGDHNEPSDQDDHDDHSDPDEDQDDYEADDDSGSDEELLAFIRATRLGAAATTAATAEGGNDNAALQTSADEQGESDATQVTQHERLDGHDTYDHQLQQLQQSQSQSQSLTRFGHSHFTLSNFSTATNDNDDEWQEAFTAKGRVYYYNRRTRESSWKRPESLAMREPEAPSPQTQQFALGSSFASSRFTASQYALAAASSTGPTATTTSTSVTVSTTVSPESQDFLFCAFCGVRTVGAQAATTHAAACSSLQFHRSHRTALHQQFEQLLSVLVDDASLRSLHYATAFPAAKPLAISATALAHYKDKAAVTDGTDEPAVAPIESSLYLLHRRQQQQHDRADSHRRDIDRRTEQIATADAGRRSSDRSRTNGRGATAAGARTNIRLRERNASERSVESTSSTASSTRRRRNDSVSDATSSSRSAASASASTGNTASYHETETCRYCSRSFAEGRLAKHEAVCPRVFGTEGSWGRGALVTQTTQQQQTSPSSLAARTSRSDKRGTHRTASKSPGAKQRHTLALSYREYQAALVQCPVCARKFAPSGAQQHIAICKSVQNRPKNPLRAVNAKDFAAAG